MYVCILPYRGKSIYAQITNLNADCIIYLFMVLIKGHLIYV